jgi:hypothetical protein
MSDRTTSEFPRRLEDITTDWLAERLVESRIEGGNRLNGFSSRPVPKQGMTSLAHVLDLSYDGDPGDAPARIIAKFAVDIEPVRVALAANRGYEREISFYNHFGKDAGICVPACYWAEYDAETTACGLLLEYVDNIRTTDVFSGEVTEIEDLVTCLAPFHARWWNHPEALERLTPGLAPFLIELANERLAPALETMKGNYAEEVGDTLISLVELWLANCQTYASHERAEPQTLIHGDLHRDQILFLSGGTEPFYVIDWQMAACDTGANDLAHLLTAGLRPDQHEVHADSLIERYHAGLITAGVEDYPVEQLRDSVRMGVARLALFYMNAFALGDVAPVLAWWDGDEVRRHHSFWDVTCGWTTRALEQHSVLEYLESLA